MHAMGCFEDQAPCGVCRRRKEKQIFFRFKYRKEKQIFFPDLEGSEDWYRVEFVADTVKEDREELGNDGRWHR
jgi:hypothetical protein